MFQWSLCRIGRADGRSCDNNSQLTKGRVGELASASHEKLESSGKCGELAKKEGRFPVCATSDPTPNFSNRETASCIQRKKKKVWKKRTYPLLSPRLLKYSLNTINPSDRHRASTSSGGIAKGEFSGASCDCIMAGDSIVKKQV